MGLERLVVPIEWKATDDDHALEGYASTFGNVDLGDDIVVKGAFGRTIPRIKAEGIPLLADHVPLTAHVLGTITDAKETEKGLWIKARLSSAPSAEDVRIKMTEGHVKKLSIGYETMDHAFDDIDGRRVRLLKEIKLWEASAVVFPQNPEAAISRVKSIIGVLPVADRRRLVDTLDLNQNAADPADAVANGSVCCEDSCTAAATTYRAIRPDVVEGVCDQHKKNKHTEQAETPPGDEPGGPGDEPGDEAVAPTATTGDEPVEPSDEGVKGWDRWASQALLAGRDPDRVVDPAKRAGLEMTLQLLEADLAQR